ncbi:branched-chain amino acid ABC transporter permease, partial [Streptomyces sp. SID10244]|nr:branched-chain amino acid ABC transporter permease [Streptomyces sp. SID10244]
AYRPLRKRKAKPLAFLITAIGMSFVLQEFVHYVLPKLPIDPPLGGSSAQPTIRLVQPVKEFSLFGAPVYNLTLIIIISALVLALGTDYMINRTRL